MAIVTRTVIVLALAVAASSAAFAQTVPAGYYVSQVEFPTELPLELVDTSTTHKVRITRHASSPEGYEYLAIAEALHPPVDSIHAAVAKAHFRPKIFPEGRDLWWYSEFDGIRIPYAVTRGAVEYYLELSRTLRELSQQADLRLQEIRSSFTYDASVEHRDRALLQGSHYDDVYLVKLELSWSNYCGNLCALGFRVERVVVISRDGEVLAVSGDSSSGPIIVS